MQLSISPARFLVWPLLAAASWWLSGPLAVLLVALRHPLAACRRSALYRSGEPERAGCQFPPEP